MADNCNDLKNIPLKFNGNIIGSIVLNKDDVERIIKLTTQYHKGFNLNCKLRKNQEGILEITEFFISQKK